MKALLLISALLGLLAILASCTREVTVVKEVVVTPTPIGTHALPASRTLTVLVGAGEDTVAIHQYFPKSVRIRAGDTLVWKIDSDEIHTVSFLSGSDRPDFAIPVPGGGPKDFMLNPQVAFPSRAFAASVEVYSGSGYHNSGIMYKESPSPKSPTNDTFSLTFDTPGSYEYVDLRHPLMKGTVTVQEAINPASIPEELAGLIPQIPTQAEMDSQGRQELSLLLAEIEKIRETSETVRNEPGPNGTTIWHVQAGGVYLDPAAELLEFMPKELSVQEGDTVIWTATTLHSITFHPGEPHPQLILPGLRKNGPPFLTINPRIAFPQKPSGEFDGTGFWSAGYIGASALPGGSTYAMTFTKSGTFEYTCAIHRQLGMEGTITVVPR